jgi:K+-transporting ATPase ATPase A chain
LIFSIGAALTNVFGRMVGSQRQGLGDLRRDGRAVPRRCDDLLLGGGRRQPSSSRHSMWTRRRAHCSPAATWKARRSASAPANSALFTTVTTDASCGAVNNMHDSLLPIAGMVPMVNIMLGEIISGGVGSGSTACCCSSSSRCSSPG